MARLDRLAAVKDVAQIGATIGREFSFRLLAAVAGLPQADLRSALARLVGTGLAFERSSPPEASYTFKHALVQDAAYRSLLRSRRRQLHGQIATVLEADYPQTAIAEPELLAHHFTEAGLVERALDHWFRAGELAIGRSANHEAISHLSHALECLARLPASLERDRRELAVHNAIGGPLIAVRGYAAREVGEAYSRARVLCEQLGETRPVCRAKRRVRASFRACQLPRDAHARRTRKELGGSIGRSRSSTLRSTECTPSPPCRRAAFRRHDANSSKSSTSMTPSSIVRHPSTSSTTPRYRRSPTSLRFSGLSGFRSRHASGAKRPSVSLAS